MFESIRKHSKITMFLLFLLIVPSFVLVGIDRNYFSGGSPVVARVDGHDITQADWDNAHRVESDRVRAQQPTLDARLLDSPQARYATLERMVRDRVLQVAAQKMHLATSDARLARSLQEIPQISALKRADGTLDVEAYRALVGAQGMTPEGFEATVRRDLAVNQVLGGVMGTAFATQAQANVSLDALFQRREIQVVRFDPADFAAQVKPSEADLEAYYKAHPALFQQPEQAAVEYVVLDLDSVRAGITLNEDDLRTYYKENVARLAGKEERRASHILIAAPKDAPAAEREKAKARATALLEQVRKAPASFADVAKKSSEDSGSAAQGGDLNFFARGAMVKPFEDAAFALKKGEISDLVESDFGYHIILLTDIKAPRQPSFEELRPSMEVELKQQQAQRKFAEVAEAFANAAYEQSDTLQPVVDKLKLKLQTAQNVTRTPAPGATGPLANAKFLEALFSADSLEHKRNTEAVEIAPNQMVAGRVTQYSPARTLPLQEVQARVRQLYIGDTSAELARKQGEAKLAAWVAKPDSATGLSAPLVVGRDQPQNQPRALVDAVLSTKADTLPAWTGVSLGAQGYVIAKLGRVLPTETVDAQRAAQHLQQYEQWWAGAEGMAYYEMLKDRFKAQIKVPRPTATADIAER
ncbi:peptidylprolyl isomerase [Rhodococcus sp. SRB_17]|uniref:SurA N-terminal domain-containing protein n=1 Tax=Acidovorax sp. SRB_24 TaxID=1962700 RepID=UPI00145E332E|nr:SurA N-terminal domain-containing protein [Acidovorax sp. SRB_24]NMM76209.1 peptidylprolyl isomerase [Acidovorax sp. SRB_24]NMM89275.1 peptidylprolyl isomerase [Rhodococcus sp. SRB_17]